MNKNITYCICMMWVLLTTGAYAVSMDMQIESSILQRNSKAGMQRMMCTDTLRCSLSLTSQIYSPESIALIWSHDGKVSENAKQLIQLIQNSYQEGLNPQDYHLDSITQLTKQISDRQSQQLVPVLGDLDVTLTDAFLLYAKHMATGRVDNRVMYPKWTIGKRKVNLSDLLNQSRSGSVTTVISGLTPTYPGYAKLKDKLHDYQKIAENGGWKDIPRGETLKLGSHGERVKLLQKRLALTEGYSPSFFADDKFDEKMRQAINKFQANHGLKVNGTVDKATLQALNTPVDQVIKVIALNLDRLRWLPLQMGDSYLLVNIPNFSLDVIENNQSVLSMPVIVGKRTTPSCILSSTVSYIEVNPFWSVPSSIAGKELLPKLQKDPSYTLNEQINVYDGSYNSEPIDPRDVDWKKVTLGNMPYKFRQMPGEKNALGHIKFIFPNVCGIYLHDTPTRNLFNNRNRGLSHGCIRVGKPLDLAQYLLRNNSKWNTEKIESAIASGKRQIINTPESESVEIIYATTWVDKDNQLQFRNDIYNVDKINYSLYNGFTNKAN